MKFRHDDMPDRINKDGVKIQSRDCGELNVAHICFPAGADARPLLQGLPGDLCQVPHWGMVLEGSINVEYADGTTEKVSEGEVYYWPPGHTVSVDETYRAIEFSPKEGMGELIDHLKGKMGA
jgi:hypothetical protein